MSLNIEKALVVDDSKVAHLTLRKLLSERGINVDWVGSGEEGIDYLKRQQPDVVFMDVMMPGMDGFETAHAVTNNGEIKAPPIIMCSANTTEEDKRNASNNGATGFLTKPYTPEELDEVLDLVRQLPEDVAMEAVETEDAELLVLEETASDGDQMTIDWSPFDGQTVEEQPTTSELEPADSAMAMPSGDGDGDDGEWLQRVEQTAWATADEVARNTASEIARTTAETSARSLAENYQRKATQIAAKAAQTIAERVARDTARDNTQALFDELAGSLREQLASSANAAGGAAKIDVEGLRKELNQGLEQRMAVQIREALQQALHEEDFKALLAQALPPPAASDELSPGLEEKVRETAIQAAWEAIEAKQDSSAGGKIAGTALFFSIVSLGLIAALFAQVFFL